MPEFATIDTTVQDFRTQTPLPDGDYLFEVEKVRPKYWPVNEEWNMPESWTYSLQLRVLSPQEHNGRVIFHPLEPSKENLAWKIGYFLRVYGYNGKIVYDKTADHWNGDKPVVWDIAFGEQPEELIAKAMETLPDGSSYFNISADTGAPAFVGFRFMARIKTRYIVKNGERQARPDIDVYSIASASEWQGWVPEDEEEDPELAKNFSVPAAEPAGL